MTVVSVASVRFFVTWQLRMILQEKFSLVTLVGITHYVNIIDAVNDDISLDRIKT
jgi:hypothetical protein